MFVDFLILATGIVVGFVLGVMFWDWLVVPKSHS